MNALFFILLTLFLIVVQTVILPSFPWFAQCFDLVIIDVLFLSLVSTHYAMIFAIIVIGCIMDSLSGVPFCYHVFSYVWIYIIVHLGKQLLFKQSIIFILVVSLLSVLVQHGLLLFSLFVYQGENTVWTLDFGLLIRQAFWGFVFIPLGIWVATVCRQNWNFTLRFLHRRFVQSDGGWH